MTSWPIRLHWVDTLAAAIVVLAIAGGAVGYRALRGSQPKVDALEPAIIRPATATRVRLRGRDFRPFVKVYAVRAGVPFVLHDQFSGSPQVTFFLRSSREAELDIPAFASGVYDLYLYDQGQRVGVLPAALRVQPEPRQPVTMAATVRFFMPAEMVPLIHVGDRDRRVFSRDAADSVAEVRTIATRPGLAETVDLRQMEPGIFSGPKTFSRVVDARLTVPVTRDDAGVWTYRGAAVRAGEYFAFETGRYVVSGITLDVDTPK